jgi:nicotinate phosphoribosyltransferase
MSLPHDTSLDSPLLTDLYELTMLQAYFDCAMREVATFEFFVRKLPPARNFLVAAGLAQALDYLAGLRFSPADLDWLAGTRRFSPAFLDWLESFRFTGDVHAMAEGTVFFPDEPILRVTAPLLEGQFVESRLINLLHYQTLIASKAARTVLAADGKMLIDFGLRRAHAGEAGLLSARASYLVGYAGTATTLAGMRFGIPVFGTMAHSYVQAHDDEADAFEHFARAQPGNATLLIDSYDTELGAAKVVEVARRLAADGIKIRGVRIDSGDLAAHACRVRRILDDGGLADATIVVSGNLDEYRVAGLIESGAPIDAFGVGTRMNTSADAPYLDCAYKLTEYAGAPRRKRSEGKATWPGAKQVYRRHDADRTMIGDALALDAETVPGSPLLAPAMVAGVRLDGAADLEASRAHAKAELASLPSALRALETAVAYPVEVTPALVALAHAVDAGTANRHSGAGHAPARR